MRKTHFWTDEEKLWIKNNIEGVPIKKLCEKFNEHFNLNISHSTFKSFIYRYGFKNSRDEHFKKGHLPWNLGTKGIMRPNKGSFRTKGSHRPERPIGYETIYSNGYTKIKTEDGWRLKHHVLWEQHSGEPVKPDEMVIFLDKNPKNCTIENLQKITKGNLALINQAIGWTEDAEINETIINLAKLRGALNKHE